MDIWLTIVPMYIETVPNRSSPPAILLREGWREGGKVKKRTLANLSKWPPPLDRGIAKSCSRAAPRCRRPRRHRRRHPLHAPWPRRRRARALCANCASTAPIAGVGLARAPARAGADRRPDPRPRLETGGRPGLGRGDRARLARRDAGAGATAARTISTPPWTGCSSAGTPSSGAWPSGISRTAPWCFTT